MEERNNGQEQDRTDYTGNRECHGSGKYQGTCTIYCHKEAGEALLSICRLTLAEKFLKGIGDRILICEVEDGEEKEILLCSKQ